MLFCFNQMHHSNNALTNLHKIRAAVERLMYLSKYSRVLEFATFLLLHYKCRRQNY